MSERQPANVPDVFDPRWLRGNQSPASLAQIRHLSDLIFLEEINAEEFFGAGFTTVRDLSSWSAHWAITAIEGMQAERHKKQAEEKYREHEEHITKAYFAAMFRAKKAGKL